MCLSQSPRRNGGIIQQILYWVSVMKLASDRSHCWCYWVCFGSGSAGFLCQAGINHCLGQCWPSFYVTIWHQRVDWYAIHHIKSLLIKVMPHVFKWWLLCVCIIFCFSPSCVCLSLATLLHCSFYVLALFLKQYSIRIRIRTRLHIQLLVSADIRDNPKLCIQTGSLKGESMIHGFP